MNVWLFIAGIFALFTATIHIVAGREKRSLILAKVKTNNIEQVMLYSYWHSLSVLLALTGFFLIYIATQYVPHTVLFVAFVTCLFFALSLLMSLIAVWQMRWRGLIKCPQWTLLFLINICCCLGLLEMS